MTDSSGTVVSVIDVDPFGGETSRSSNVQVVSQRFTSYERDANGGDEAQARRFEGQWTRFSQPDPSVRSYRLRDPQSFNRYSYASNDPVNRRDPSGMEDEVHPFVCLNCVVNVSPPNESGVGSTISGFGDLLGRTLYEELLPNEGLTPGQQQLIPTPEELIDKTIPAVKNLKETYKQAREYFKNCVASVSARVKREVARLIPSGDPLRGLLTAILGRVIARAAGGALIFTRNTPVGLASGFLADQILRNFEISGAIGIVEEKYKPAFDKCIAETKEKYGLLPF